jgi:hypothetical protein
MTGAPDPAYVLARRVLLDALDALGAHRDSIILVGAQAVYLHTGASQMAVPEYTTDADLALDPRLLQPHPLLADVLGAAHFRPGKNPGTWIGASDVEVDLLVPDSLGGGGRRGARLEHHGNLVARKAKGLEAALVDHAQHRIVSLEPAVDPRRHDIRVAGPAALVIAKLHKIADRTGGRGRAEDKDALDVLRLLQAIPTADLGGRFVALLAEWIAAEVTREAIEHLKALFATPGGAGAEMAARAVVPLDDPDTIRASCAVLASDLVAACRETGR